MATTKEMLAQIATQLDAGTAQAEQVELLTARLAARDAQLASQSQELAALKQQATAAAAALATRTEERDAARAQVIDLTPPAGSVVTRAEFKRRLWLVYVGIGSLATTAGVRERWVSILGDLLADYPAVRLDGQLAQQIVAQAVTDGFLTQQQAAAVLTTS